MFDPGSALHPTVDVRVTGDMHHRSRSIFDLGEWNVASLQLFDHCFG
jgi:hypothetical protein